MSLIQRLGVWCFGILVLALVIVAVGPEETGLASGLCYFAIGYYWAAKSDKVAEWFYRWPS